MLRQHGGLQNRKTEFNSPPRCQMRHAASSPNLSFRKQSPGCEAEANSADSHPSGGIGMSVRP